MQWWIAERAKGRLAAHVISRPKCESGSGCTNQTDIRESILGLLVQRGN